MLAAGLVLVMVGAMVFHVTRGEFADIVSNVVLGGLSAFVAYGRWKLRPIAGRGKPGPA